MMQVTCPYCGNPAQLVDSAIVYRGRSYGLIWDCRPCDAYVGVHKNSKDHAPLGRLANAELRTWKRRAHDAFDPLWRNGYFTRKEAYAYMRDILHLTSEQAHIGKFDVGQCKRLIEALETRNQHTEG